MTQLVLALVTKQREIIICMTKLVYYMGDVVCVPEIIFYFTQKTRKKEMFFFFFWITMDDLSDVVISYDINTSHIPSNKDIYISHLASCSLLSCN